MFRALTVSVTASMIFATSACSVEEQVESSPDFDIQSQLGAGSDATTLSFADFEPTTEDAAACVYERSFAVLGSTATPCHMIAGVPSSAGASVMRVSSYFFPAPERPRFAAMLVTHDPSTGPYYEAVIPDSVVDVPLGNGIIARHAEYTMTRSSHIWTRIIASGEGDAFFGVHVNFR